MGLKQTPIVEFAVATTSYQDLLEAQKDLFQSQVEKLQYIVATQCKLTGVNPLSQEMAAGALSIKIGKRPRDLMNLNAIKYMKSVFSTRDAITKKDSREISAHLGVTVTQVRDFFTGQRSRVRKFVRLSGKKAGRSAAHVAVHDGMELPLDPNMPAELVPLETMAPENVEEGRSCSTQHDVPTGMKKLDRHFVANIFGLMRREESFTRQVKLLKWILRIKNCSVLKWFVTRGGVLTLATWLSQAAMEEQTSLAYVILKVLSSLPVCEAIPVHISAMLLSVNRLRFYRRPGISSRARAQLCKWSNILNEMWKSRGLKSASYSQAEMLLKQSINEVMINSSWESKDGNTEALEFLSKNPDNHEKLDMAQPLKMLMASGSDSNKRRSVLPSQTRERRKVKMVEHPDQRLAVRSPLVAKSTPPPRCRPLSADDIQKAKMRAEFMQGRKGKKPIACSDDQLKPKSLNSCSCYEMTVLPSASVSYVRPELEEGTKLESVICRVASPQETHLDLDGHPWYRRLQIPWQTPQGTFALSSCFSPLRARLAEWIGG